MPSPIDISFEFFICFSLSAFSFSLTFVPFLNRDGNRETDLDTCIDQTTEDLEASNLFDLSRVCSSQAMVFYTFCSFFFQWTSRFSRWCIWGHFRTGVLPTRGWFIGTKSIKKLRIRNKTSIKRQSVFPTRSWRLQLPNWRRNPVFEKKQRRRSLI